MKEDLIDIIMSKEYFELNDSERSELNEFVQNEDEFIQMKGVLMQVHQVEFESPTPRPEVKQSLDDLFHQQHPNTAPVWWSSTLAVIVPRDKTWHQQPLVRVAALALIFLIAVPFFKNNITDNNNVVVADNQMKQTEEQAINKKDLEASDKLFEEPNAVDEDVAEEIDMLNQEQTVMDIELDNNLTSSAEVVSRNADMNERPGSFSFLTEPSIESTFAGTADETVSADFMHPDGVYAGIDDVDSDGYMAGGSKNKSMCVSSNTDVLDILTAAF